MNKFTKFKTNTLLPLFLLLFLGLTSLSQTTSVKFGKGLKFVAKDSSMSMKLTFRFQTLFAAEQTIKSDLEVIDDFNSSFMIRRSRIKLDGFVYNPKLEYKVELALSNRDIGLGKADKDQENFNTASNIVLDAVLKYEFAKNTEVWVGQTKLPSNRERVISSQKLQFVDRSILNNAFNLDRDVGARLAHKSPFGENFITKEIISISMGEGRNVTSANDYGFCYTGHVEILPFGEFANDGDFSGSDLEREPKPKLAIGLTYDYNDNAGRTRGQLGSFITDPSKIRDLQSFHADFMFKLKGFSAMGEYAKRFVANDDPSVYYVGDAVNIQAGYLLRSNIEWAFRYAQLRPDNWDSKKGEIIAGNRSNQFTLGLSKYFVKHSLKIQTDVSSLFVDKSLFNALLYRFQIEMQF